MESQQISWTEIGLFIIGGFFSLLIFWSIIRAAVKSAIMAVKEDSLQKLIAEKELLDDVRTKKIISEEEYQSRLLLFPLHLTLSPRTREE